ncbi:MAG TPA: glycosyltransferase [Chitinophagaceae bacterium]|nr:glycosyltransferase [Chitinophagaceae bacterium]
MITVIIPVLNEGKTIGNVVKYCFSQPGVSEVIVIDDHSQDDSVRQARMAGAIVIFSAIAGKGMSMKEGIAYANTDVLVFLDGDIDPYPMDTIAALAAPVIRDECDFVKAAFSRNAGRVTELVAKPLLTLLFPDLAVFNQPLSGMIGGKKNLFQKIDFFYDYGVDIGILIDMFHMKARIKEVNIGYIQNKSKPWDCLVKMSKEVAGAILKKAKFPLPDDRLAEGLRTIHY